MANSDAYFCRISFLDLGSLCDLIVFGFLPRKRIVPYGLRTSRSSLTIFFPSCVLAIFPIIKPPPPVSFALGNIRAAPLDKIRFLFFLYGCLPPLAFWPIVSSNNSCDNVGAHFKHSSAMIDYHNALCKEGICNQYFLTPSLTPKDY